MKESGTSLLEWRKNGPSLTDRVALGRQGRQVPGVHFFSTEAERVCKDALSFFIWVELFLIPFPTSGTDVCAAALTEKLVVPLAKQP